MERWLSMDYSFKIGFKKSWGVIGWCKPFETCKGDSGLLVLSFKDKSYGYGVLHSPAALFGLCARVDEKQNDRNLCWYLDLATDFCRAFAAPVHNGSIETSFTVQIFSPLNV